MPDTSYERELGGIQQRLKGQDTVLAAQTAQLQRIELTMNEMQGFMQQHKGGVRAIVMLGSLSGALAAGLGWIISTLLSLRHP